MSIIVRSIVLLFVLVPGCDTMPGAPPKIEETRVNASGDRSGLAACLHECKEQELSPTDAATCRNNCQMAFKVTPTASEPGLDQAASCLYRCETGENDAAGCAKRCRRTAAEAGVAADVLDRLGQCVGGCAKENGPTTDRWTCVRNCAQSAKVAPEKSAS
ncbi:MAG TPA: hypothetical protein VIK91_12790 [Nannocystis sp.]